jgi:hypothetical protein
MILPPDKLELIYKENGDVIVDYRYRYILKNNVLVFIL